MKKLLTAASLAVMLSLPSAQAGVIEDLLDVCKYLMGTSCGGVEP